MRKKQKQKLIVIVGPTATGKTKLGVDLSLKFDGEIVSADSRQVYRGMDIGTGKDLDEYRVVLKEKGGGEKVIKISYHLIDVVSPKVRFDLAKYQKLAFEAIDNILSKNKQPFLVGGTGLYVQSVIDNYNLSDIGPNKRTREKLEDLSIEEILKKLKSVSKLGEEDFKNVSKEKNKRRLIRYLEYCLTTKKSLKNLFKKNELKYDLLILGLRVEKELLSQRIDRRLSKWLEKEDLLGEIERLHSEGVSWKRFEEFGLEYKWASFYLRGKVSYSEMENNISRDIKKFSKRQITWFKRDKRIIWIKNYEEAEKQVRIFLKKSKKKKVCS